ELITAVQKSVVLSQGWDLWRFAAQMRARSGGDVKFYTIPVRGNATIGGASVLLVDRTKVRSFVDGLSGGASSAAAGSTPAGGGAADPADPTESAGPGPDSTTTSSTTPPSDAADSPPDADPITAGGIPCVD